MMGIKRTVIKRQLYVLMGVGLTLLVSTPSYSQDDQDRKKPTAISELFTPFIRNLGFVECTVVAGAIDPAPIEPSDAGPVDIMMTGERRP
jgi:hypothetical protein